MFTMEFNYPEETDQSSDRQNDDTGTGRSYECVFCKRGFNTAQALGGHMNIHRKDRTNNKTKQNFPPSSSSKVDDDNNYANLRFYSSAIPSHLAGQNYYSTAPHEVDANNYYHQVYFPAPTCGIRSSHVQYSELLCVENQRDHLFGQDWGQRNLSSLYANQLCVPEIKDKFEDNSEEGGVDLELRLGHHP